MIAFATHVVDGKWFAQWLREGVRFTKGEEYQTSGKFSKVTGPRPSPQRP